MYIHLSLQEEIVHNNFLMGLIFWKCWRVALKKFSCQPSAAFANQLKQASQAQSTLAKRANQASYARLHSRLQLPSPTGRRSHFR